MTSVNTPPSSSVGQPRRDFDWLLFPAIALLVMALWACWGAFGVTWTLEKFAAAKATPEKLAQLGQVGDLFGGVNALFAALALVGVLWAGTLQRRSLLEARMALSEDRAQQEHQRFEQSFFQILGLFRELASSLQLTAYTSAPVSTNREIRADQAVRDILGERRSTFDYYGETERVETELLFIQEVSRDLFRANDLQLSPLFLTLQELLLHISEFSDRTPTDVRRYVGLVQAQMHQSLLILMALYALGGHTPALIGCIDRFALLKPIARDDYLRTIFGSTYGPAAFGQKD